MPQSRGHRTMTAAEQQARGAGARRRSDRVSEQDLNDAERYRRMRRQREDENPLNKARRNAAERLGEAEGAVGGLLESGDAHRRAAGAFGGFKEKLGQKRRRGGAPREPRGGGARTAKRVLVGILVAILAFSVVLTVRLGAGISMETRLALAPALPGQPFYTLLVGTDKSAEREADGSTGGTYRTDSIILARVDPLSAKLTLVSIQRDTLVDLDEHGKQKINAAYTYGGASLLIKAVSDLAGVKISHYAEIDFDSFTSVVDDLGGIDVNVPIDLDDDYAGIHLKAGEQTIDGAQALGLCRARHAYDKYGSGDYYRTSNQRMVLGAILKKALSGSPVMLLSTLSAASESVSTDITGLELMLLGARFAGFDMSRDLYSGLEPTGGVYEGGVWYEKVDEAAWKTMMGRVDAGLPPYESEDQDPTAGVAGITQ